MVPQAAGEGNTIGSVSTVASRHQDSTQCVIVPSQGKCPPPLPLTALWVSSLVSLSLAFSAFSALLLVCVYVIAFLLVSIVLTCSRVLPQVK